MKKIDQKLRYKRNPRTITDEQLQDLKDHIEELGDLSGVVYCRKNKAYVGGNQRSKIFDGADITVTEEFDKPTKSKTVLLGYVNYAGEKHNYREVEFTKAEFEKACIVANNDGGTFDWDALEGWDGDLLKSWGMEMPDRFDIPVVEHRDTGGKGGVNNKYLMNATLMVSINRSTFAVKHLTDEEKRKIWDACEAAEAHSGSSEKLQQILGNHLLKIAEEIHDEVLSDEAVGK